MLIDAYVTQQNLHGALKLLSRISGEQNPNQISFFFLPFPPSLMDFLLCHFELQ
jgi:hypothetical protein